MFFTEDVIIKDSFNRTFRLAISTPMAWRLSMNLAKAGNFKTWRPSPWGGDWEVEDLGPLSVMSGDVWFRRSGNDYRAGMPQGSILHLDIFLADGEDGPDSCEITLSSFLALNGMNSGGGRGYLGQPWALQVAPGEITWKVPGRAVSP